MIEYTLEYEENRDNVVDEDFGIVDVRCYGGSPVEINGTIWNLKEEVENWLNSDIIGQYEYDASTSVVQFKAPEDAMLFKLAWL
ncbi:hypothetical protein D3C71_1069650 [compost metagenome]